jgi:hypothetical protein
MSDSDTSMWFVILPILLTGVFSAVSWMVRGKYEHSKQLHSQFTYMKMETRLTNLKNKLEEFYWPIYLRLVRHLHYTKRFHKISAGDLNDEIPPIEEHMDDTHFLPFATTPRGDKGETEPLVIDIEDERKDGATPPPVENETETEIKNVIEDGLEEELDDEKTDESQVNIDFETEQPDEAYKCEPEQLNLEVSDLVNEVKQLENTIGKVYFRENIVKPMVNRIRKRSQSRVGELISDLKDKTGKLINMKKLYNRLILDNLLEIKDIFEKKTAISTPDQQMGKDLLNLDLYIATYQTSFESGNVYTLPNRQTHGVEFPFEIVDIIAKKLAEYQKEYDDLLENLDEIKDDENGFKFGKKKEKSDNNKVSRTYDKK